MLTDRRHRVNIHSVIVVVSSSASRYKRFHFLFFHFGSLKYIKFNLAFNPFLSKFIGLNFMNKIPLFSMKYRLNQDSFVTLENKFTSLADQIDHDEYQSNRLYFLHRRYSNLSAIANYSFHVPPLCS